MIDSAIKREFSVLENNGDVEEMETGVAAVAAEEQEIAVPSLEPKSDDFKTKLELADGQNGANNSKRNSNTRHDEINFLTNDSSNDYQSEDDDYSTTSTGNNNNDEESTKNSQLDLVEPLKKNGNHQEASEFNGHRTLSANGKELHQSARVEMQQRHHSVSGNTGTGLDEPEQMRKLFIGGLDYKTSEETLRKHFEKFGEVTDCVVMREPQSKRSRGFGFVIYANSSQVDEAQEARPHEVDGREVQSKRAISREDSGRPEAQATVKKVYIGGLSDDIEEFELRDYFKTFGNIMSINIMQHKDTGKRRGFAFVEYDDYDPVDKIVLKKFHVIKDKRIETKKAIPKPEMDARKRVGPGGPDPRAAIANSIIALSGSSMDGMPPGGRQRSNRSIASSGLNACFWDGYGSGHDYFGGLDGGYPPPLPPPPHYGGGSGHHHYGGGGGSWMMHGASGSSYPGNSYGFRSAYGRNNYANQISNWTTATDYNSAFLTSQSGGAGPMRLSYQHRSMGPYGSGYGTNHRGRGYNS